MSSGPEGSRKEFAGRVGRALEGLVMASGNFYLFATRGRQIFMAAGAEIPSELDETAAARYALDRILQLQNDLSSGSIVDPAEEALSYDI